MPSTTVGTPSSFGLLLLLAAWYNNELAIVDTVINAGRSSLKSALSQISSSLKSAPPRSVANRRNEAKRAPSDKDSQGAIRSSNGALWIRILYIRKELMSRNDILLQEILGCGPMYHIEPQNTLQRVGPRK